LRLRIEDDLERGEGERGNESTPDCSVGKEASKGMNILCH